MNSNELIPHLFRTEYSKLVSVLTKLFGLAHVEIAEDMASETFVLAMETWAYKGIPENPTAWLYTVAKNKAKNHLMRDKVFREKVSDKVKLPLMDDSSIDLSEKHIQDSQLQMLFAICHPSISAEAQICLALRILCGFGLNEIADAFLTNKETIHKRLQRAKEKLRSEHIEIDMPDDSQLNSRLDAVLHTIYLLFSEGYYSESNNAVIRKELCVEAIHLSYLLLSNPQTNTHSSNSLLSLMCFQASRLEARQSKNGQMVLYEAQDKQLWDTELIEKGFYYLQQASRWEITSRYYIEASIAYWYTVPQDTIDKWTSILKLYDALLMVAYSPVADLNRIFALAKVHGNRVAIAEAEKLNLQHNHFYFVLLAELYKHIDSEKSKTNLQIALAHCKTDMEREMLKKQIESFI